MAQVTYETVGSVAVVTMSNPPANTFSDSVAVGMFDALARAKKDGIRAMVIQADGPLFSGGADINLFKGLSARAAREKFSETMGLISGLEQAPFPVISAVHGMCLAAGLEISLACDLIIAAEGTQFAQVEAHIGATTFLGGVYRLAERCGPARAAEIVFFGDHYDAETFERWNVINRIVPADELRSRALEWAQRLAAGPTSAHVVSKRLIRYAADHGVRQADSYMLDAAIPLFESRDMQHAVGLMLEQGYRKFIQNHDDVIFEGI